MSRNKTIVLLHETTLKPFKDCRAALKRNKWNFAAAYYEMLGGLDWRDFGATIAEAIDAILPAINAAVQAFARLNESLRRNLPEIVDSGALQELNGKLYQNDANGVTTQKGA